MIQMPSTLPPMSVLTWILAMLPLIVVLVLMFRFKVSGPRAGVIAWVITLVIAYFVFKAGPQVLLAGSIKGVWTTLSVLFIIWSSMFLYNIVNETGSFKVIANTFTRLTNGNRLLQLLILGWAFPTFVQGVCGFGVPVAVATPLLIGLGFDPMLSVITALMGHSWGITFGSLGASYEALYTPSFGAWAGEWAGTGAPDAWRAPLAMWGSIFIAFGGVIVGLCILHHYRKYVPEEEKGSVIRKGLPAVLFLSVVMGLVMVGVCTWLVPNIGCFIAGAAGLGLGALVLPKMKAYKGTGEEFKPQEGTPNLSFLQAFSGYLMLFAIVLVCLLEVKGVFSNPIKQALASVKFGYNAVESVTGTGFTTPASFQSLNLTTPGVLIVVSSIVAICLYKAMGALPKGAVGRSLMNTAKQSIGSTTTVIAMTMMAVVMTESGLTTYIAYGIAAVAGSFFPFLAPFIGLLGGFVTSSGTSSNVLFAGLQFEVANALKISPFIILAEQTTASSLSNSFSPGNASLGTGVSNQSGKEGEILKVTGFYNMIQSALVGLLGILLINVLHLGL